MLKKKTIERKVYSFPEKLSQYAVLVIRVHLILSRGSWKIHLDYTCVKATDER